MQSLKVSVIIVSYNTKQQLQKCLEHLYTSQTHDSLLEVIVVDNASSDGSASMVQQTFPIVRLIESRSNLGFGKANNLGAQSAEGDLLLFLNSDAYAHAESLDNLSNAFSDTGIVAGGGMLLNTDGSLQESVAGRLTIGAVLREQFFLDRIARLAGRSYWRTSLLPAQTVVEVDQVMGACLMVRKDAFEPFDPRFFLYCEDTELCERLHKKGKIVYVRDAKFTHELGSSSKENRWRAVARYNLGKELYFGIHHGPLSRYFCFVLNRAGAFSRMLFSFSLALPLAIFGKLPYLWEKGRLFFKVLLAKKEMIIPSDYIPE